MDPGNQNCEQQIYIESTTNAGDINSDDPDKDVDGADGFTDEIGVEDNFENDVKDGTGTEENSVVTSRDNDADNEDGSDEDTGDEEHRNANEERKKRSLAENNLRLPHRTHKRFNQKRLKKGKLPYKLIDIRSLKARLAQRNSNQKSWRQKRAGKFSILRF